MTYPPRRPLTFKESLGLSFLIIAYLVISFAFWVKSKVESAILYVLCGSFDKKDVREWRRINEHVRFKE